MTQTDRNIAEHIKEKIEEGMKKESAQEIIDEVENGS